MATVFAIILLPMDGVPLMYSFSPLMVLSNLNIVGSYNAKFEGNVTGAVLNMAELVELHFGGPYKVIDVLLLTDLIICNSIELELEELAWRYITSFALK
jgi:hypothetical protein